MEKSCEVLFDTNFLTLPQKFKIDIIKETQRLVPNAKLITLEQVPPELKKLKQGAIGQQMIERGTIKVVPWESQGDADKAILEYALKHKTIVATNDKALKEQLRNLKVPVIYLRGRKKLELRGNI